MTQPSSEVWVQHIICSFFLTVNEILGTAAKERSAESPSSTEESKSSKGVWPQLKI